MKIPIRDFFRTHGIEDSSFEYDETLDAEIEINNLKDWEKWINKLDAKEKEYENDPQLRDVRLRYFIALKKRLVWDNSNEFFQDLIFFFRFANIEFKWLEFWEKSFVWLVEASNKLSELKPEHYWRIEVLKRDNFKCRVCGKLCNSAHHIYSRKYCQKHAPELEWDTKNGISACYECHKEITIDGRKWFESNEKYFKKG